MLGHIIFKKGIEVDKAKIEMISKLPSPTNVKTVRKFLRHAGFYRRFIRTSRNFPSLFISYWRKMLNLCGTKTARGAWRSSRHT